MVRDIRGLFDGLRILTGLARMRGRLHPRRGHALGLGAELARDLGLARIVAARASIAKPFWARLDGKLKVEQQRRR